MGSCFLSPGRACEGEKQGLLCTSCSARIATLDRLCPEQITSRLGPDDSTGAALLDRFGRLHPLAERTRIGRDAAVAEICIADACVSREHVELRRDGDGWTVRDMSSSNGTQLNGVTITTRARVRAGDVLSVASVGFYFIDGPRVEDDSLLDRMPVQTLSPTQRADELSQHAAEPAALGPMREIDIAFCEPSGGGGGILAVSGRAIQLTETQFQLMQVLAQRMRTENGQPEVVRGFVRSGELIGTLSWDTTHPDENHLKQLVRRLRRTLERAQLGDLIESRHRFGYRLRVVPRAP